MAHEWRPRCASAKRRAALLLVLPLACALPTAAPAQIRTDGTLGGPAVALSGPNFLIDQGLGRIAGNNLFHSFQTFNVQSAESATFVTTSPGLANVISRVTGGSASRIDGLLSVQSTDAAPNFFFINPAGVVFGQGAQIDVPAGFHVSTANYIGFPDGSFHADPNAASTLSTAAPEAFGFLGTTRTAITLGDGARLQTRSPGDSQPISVVAGDISIAGGQLRTVGSDIRVVAIGSGTSEVGLTGALPAAFGDLEIVGGGRLLSERSSTAGGGNIRVAAGKLLVDGAGIESAGDIDVAATGAVSVVNAGSLIADTYSSGNAGTITVKAGSIVVDGRGTRRRTTIASRAQGSTGNAGSIELAATGTVAIVDGGFVDASSFSSGAAGGIEVSAGDVNIDGRGSRGPTGIFSQAESGFVHGGKVVVTTTGNLAIAGGGVIDTSITSSGRAGQVSVRAGQITIDGKGSNPLAVTGILSNTILGAEAGGLIDIVATGNVSIADSGRISLTSFATGDAGRVTISAGDLAIDGRGNSRGTGIFSGTTGSGKAGEVAVAAAGAVSIRNGGSITATSFSSGDAGTVKVSAGSIALDGDGYGGTTGIFNDAGGSGRAGSVDVAATGLVSIVNGSVISTDTFSSGAAGSVRIRADSVLIDGRGNSGRTGIFSSPIGIGNGGTVDVVASGPLSITNGGAISLTSYSSGNAGSVRVDAGSITIDGTGYGGGPTGVFSEAGGSGDAGTVDVAARSGFSILDGIVSSSTIAAGAAGAMRIRAGSLIVDGNGSERDNGIFSEALRGSSGRTGTVAVEAGDAITIANGASVSIRNDATIDRPGSVTPALLSVSAPNISLAGGGAITAASSGNVAASNIEVSFGPRLTLSDALISTSAKDGNGGSVAVSGTGTLLLQNGRITTSVTGTRGSGGDIGIAAPQLVMQTGFIQANTAAVNASGGNVNIAVDALLPSGGTLFVGGQQPYAYAPGVFGFNVIQAAAPTGVSGTISISTPALDIAGSLGALPAKFLDAGGLGRSPCAIVGGSSIARVGRGGVPRTAGNWLWNAQLFAADAAAPAGSGSPVTLSGRAGDGAAREGAPC